jgi:hypothetical protein
MIPPGARARQRPGANWRTLYATAHNFVGRPVYEEWARYPVVQPEEEPA